MIGPTKKSWGSYTIYINQPGLKVKTLYLEPGERTSNQKHNYRSEIMFIISGVLSLQFDHTIDYKFSKDMFVVIDKGRWHQLINHTKEPVKILEIQYGEKCEELDKVVMER